MPEPLQGDALIALDKLDKIGRDGVQKELMRARRRRGRDAGVPGVLQPAWRARSRRRRHDRGSQTFVPRHRRPGRRRVDELERSSGSRDGDAGARPASAIDPSLARGLSYYTGAIMEIAVPDLAGSLGGGGRYDNLVGMFLGRDVPACGFSLGLERIIVVMTERDMFPAKVSRGAVDVMVTFLDDGLRADALKLAAELRAEKLRVEVFPEVSPKLESRSSTRRDATCRSLAILGEDERARGEVTVRDLQTRQQEAAPRATAADWIAKRVRIVVTNYGFRHEARRSALR